ncbi:hypothetical protein BT96DRAFT_989181 [Gymnopus androsaceus JB14]|uniref:Uncharacterized protein n=1 Tax=Gymnopus androsaceus JB14 TaxID=1447944 RepID=A0A6A4I2J0_9AGAR|nr:hypothetical protein BT96DRAFT_989181 [Gymnopus androsaceus JB14]
MSTFMYSNDSLFTGSIGDSQSGVFDAVFLVYCSPTGNVESRHVSLSTLRGSLRDNSRALMQAYARIWVNSGMSSYAWHEKVSTPRLRLILSLAPILNSENVNDVSSPRLCSSAPKSTSNVTGNASLSLKPNSAVISDAAAVASTTTTTATAVKEEPLDVEVPTFDCASAASLTSGTKRYHPIPRSCLTLISVPSANASSFPTIISSSSSNGSQSAAQQVTPNPHWRTARTEFANRAINELRAEGLVVKRILWRMGEMCVDWEKPASAKASGDGDGKLKMKGKGKKRALTEAETVRAENAMAMLMNGLITMDDTEPSQSLPQVIQNTSPQLPSNTKIQVNDSDEAMEIIDLTVDEKSYPPPSYSHKIDDEDDRPPLKPPLVNLRACLLLSDSPPLPILPLPKQLPPPNRGLILLLGTNRNFSHSTPASVLFTLAFVSAATSDDGEAVDGVEVNQPDDELSSNPRQESRDTDEEMQGVR